MQMDKLRSEKLALEERYQTEKVKREALESQHDELNKRFEDAAADWDEHKAEVSVIYPPVASPQSCMILSIILLDCR